VTVYELSDLDVAGKTVLLRADLNVPLETTDAGRRITDDGRIVAALPTIRALLDSGARVVVAAHLGRPKGTPSPEFSLAPVADRLAELLEQPVVLAADVTGDSAKAVVENLEPGQVALLENVRFDARETSKDPAERAALAEEYASLADVYVSDGFGVVHREQASVTDVAALLPRAAGFLVLKEAVVFDRVLNNPDRPYAVVLGGSKVSDKLGVITNLLPSVDKLLIGGGMCFTFLAAQGREVGDSLLESDQIDTVKGIIGDAAARGVELLLPIDVVIAEDISPDAETKVVAVDDGIPAGWKGLDIGPDSQALFAGALADCRTVVWNGPMGVFEIPGLDAGTKAVGQALVDLDDDTMTVIGGGDSAAAYRQFGFDPAGVTHISTGGGASLEFLEGKTLPGIAALRKD
jgi:phosphoglycerate kinase